MPPQRLLAVGAGYVGLVTAIGLASAGHAVHVVEVGEERRLALIRGETPFHEPGLPEALAAAVESGRLSASGAVPFERFDQVLVCVGTPIGPDGVADLSQLRSAISSVRPLVDAGIPLVVRSTLPIGSSAAVARLTGSTERTFANPEFLRQGRALHDFLHPTRLVFGHYPDADRRALGQVIDAFAAIEGPRLVVSMESAELIKNAANAFLALRLSFANEISELAEEFGADIDDVLEGIGRDPRIGRQYLRPGFGFGGSCLPKELETMARAGARRLLPMHVTRAAAAANESSQRRFADRIAVALGGACGRRVTMLGLAFKADTDDVRASPSIEVARRLLAEGAAVVGYDPAAAERAHLALPGLEIARSAVEAALSADACIVGTEWPVFKSLDWRRIRSVMSGDLLADGRRLLDADAMRALGFRYFRVGDPVGAADRGEDIGNEARMQTRVPVG